MVGIGCMFLLFFFICFIFGVFIKRSMVFVICKLGLIYIFKFRFGDNK